MADITARHERWPLAKTFTIARGSRDAADVVVCEIAREGHIARGECVPYARYGETCESVIAQIKDAASQTGDGLDRARLAQVLAPGAARFALDAALWDLEAKRCGTSVWQQLGIDTSQPLTTAYTISYGDADTMAADAAQEAHRPLLKIKLARADDLPRLEAVRAAAPDAALVVDANEGWDLAAFEAIVPALEAANVRVVEQPLSAGQDDSLTAGAYPFALCADESCHDRASLDAIIGHYDMINIKLDKTGGLTEALAMKDAARAAGLTIMVGCMVGSSLAMAPAMAVAHDADVVDLDGPLLLRQDRPDGIAFQGSQMAFPKQALWGG